jgi:Xaa-Pro dipeptidase
MEARCDRESVRRIRSALTAAGLGAIICALPENVLLLSGYWPVVGGALALATREGRIAVLAPEDERDLAESGWADDIRTFRPVSLDAIRRIDEVVGEPLGTLAQELGLQRGPIGYEGGPASEPASYVGMRLYGPILEAFLTRVLTPCRLESAEGILEELRAAKTSREVDRIRTACRIASRAFRAGAQQLRSGMLETEAALHFRAPLSAAGTGFEGVERADGSVWCMSGPNAALAQGAYARSRARPIGRDEMVLVHCNSYADGYWVDVTRTYCLGEPDDRRRRMYEAVFAARKAALGVIRPGARAAAVDRAARDVLRDHGFGDQFTHATGHGVGFVAIDPNARPRIHPKSEDVLERGMVFNVEPAIYFDGDCGLRHCDVIAVTEDGAEVLTPFEGDIESLILR